MLYFQRCGYISLLWLSYFLLIAPLQSPDLLLSYSTTTHTKAPNHTNNNPYIFFIFQPYPKSTPKSTDQLIQVLKRRHLRMPLRIQIKRQKSLLQTSMYICIFLCCFYASMLLLIIYLLSYAMALRDISLSLYAYVSVVIIEGSYPIEWCIGEPMPVFFYRIQQYTIPLS